jgi:hypothetical protein
MRSFIILSALLLLALPARADYHYAGHEGTSEYPYTSWATAADSIQKAVDAAEAGDTVYVGAGVWAQSWVQLYEHLALIGMGIDSSIFYVDGFGGAYIETYRCNLIQDFTFRGDHYAGGGISSFRDSAIVIRNNYFTKFYMGINCDGADMLIENNIFYDNATGVDFASVFQITDDAIIKNNTFDYNYDWHLVISGGRFEVTNNVFVRKTRSGPSVVLHLTDLNDSAYFASNIAYKNAAGGTAVHEQVNGAKNVAYYNNIIIGVDSTSRNNVGILGGLASSEYPHIQANNIISECHYGLEFFGEATDTAHLFYNNYWNNDVNYFIWHASIDTIGEIHVNPMFVDSFDFHLQMYSPLIDAGHPDIFDIDGTRSDIGLYGGPYGELYEYVDLPPAVPDDLSASVDSNSIMIIWDQNTEADFAHYFMHRDTVTGFTPSAFNLIATPDTSYYVDYDLDQGHDYFYRISAVDGQDNQSAYCEELAVIFTDIGGFGQGVIPEITHIDKAYPNPFNDRVLINYHLADVGYQPAEVKLYIYDLTGRLVRKLVYTRQFPGRHQASWDGRGETGSQLASGIYFARLRVSEVELCKPLKITLLK